MFFRRLRRLRTAYCHLPTAYCSLPREVARVVEQLGPEGAAVLQLAFEEGARAAQLGLQLGVGAFEAGDVSLLLARARLKKHRVEIEHAGDGGQRQRKNEGGVKLHGFLPCLSSVVGLPNYTPSRAFAQVSPAAALGRVCFFRRGVIMRRLGGRPGRRFHRSSLPRSLPD